MKTTTAIQATVDKIETMKDGSLKLRIYTQELKSREKVELFGLLNQLCYAVFAHSETTQLLKTASELEPPKVDAGSKSPSRRLRAVMYVRFEQEGHGGDFEDFYKSEMEKIINIQKDFLS